MYADSSHSFVRKTDRARSRATSTSAPGSFHDAAQRLRIHAPWMLEDLPAFAGLRSGGACAASVQWSEGSGSRIGDAALARDALSSQGLATGASKALQACVGGEDDRALIVASAARAAAIAPALATGRA
jgi:hypothetical protein